MAESTEEIVESLRRFCEYFADDLPCRCPVCSAAAHLRELEAENARLTRVAEDHRVLAQELREARAEVERLRAKRAEPLHATLESSNYAPERQVGICTDCGALGGTPHREGCGAVGTPEKR